MSGDRTHYKHNSRDSIQTVLNDKSGSTHCKLCNEDEVEMTVIEGYSGSHGHSGKDKVQ